MSYLGSRQAKGAVDNSGNNPYGNGNYAVVFDNAVFALAANQFEVYHIAVVGPAGSSLQVFVDRTFYDATSSGDLNSWDPQQTLHMIGGQNLYLYWNTGTGTTPQVTVWIRESSPLQ